MTYTFTPTSTTTLTGGDTYWIVITGARQQFKWASATATSTGPGATYAQAGQGFLSGTLANPSIGSYGAGPGGVAGFEIDGSPASSPEPGSLALLGSAAGVAAFRGWRKRRRQGKADAEGEPSPVRGWWLRPDHTENTIPQREMARLRANPPSPNGGWLAGDDSPGE